jgi:hypothetical protein
MRSTFKTAIRIALLALALNLLFIAACILRIAPVDAIVMHASVRFGLSPQTSLYLTVSGMPAMWTLMLNRSFLEDGTTGSEIGVLLHILAMSYGIALCFQRGLEVCIPMFVLYWPFCWFVRGVDWTLHRLLDAFER